jgi:hypothetical protein
MSEDNRGVPWIGWPGNQLVTDFRVAHELPPEEGRSQDAPKEGAAMKLKKTPKKLPDVTRALVNLVKKTEQRGVALVGV